MEENPFKYGKAVEGGYFCNRTQELKDILQFMRSSSNIIIFSQRRFGKTSLIKEALRRIKKEGISTVYVDMGPVLSEKLFVLEYSRAIAESLSGSLEKILNFAKEIFTKMKPSLTVDEATQMPKVEFAIGRGEMLPYVDDVMSSVERYQKKLKKKLVVIFDEFQEISFLETDRLEKVMRKHIQTHQNISYVFAGSKRHLIYEMFNEPNRPFYKSAAHYPIKKIPHRELSDFIKKRFNDTSRKIDDDVAKYAIDICESHPYHVQFLCHIVWNKTAKGKSIQKEDVDKAVQTLIERETASYTNTWDMLTITQKKMLVALAQKKEDDKILSADFLTRYELGYASSAKAALKSLMNKDIVDKEGDDYSIIDVMFRKWILTKFPQIL